jgi:nicotinamidase-related amidase
MKLLVVVDMQNDFIDGALGSPEAVAIVPYVKSLIQGFDGKVLFTRDTHFENYMDTQERKNLPVPHCVKGTDGWQIRPELEALRKTEAIDKITFGSTELVDVIGREEDVESITFVGLCTDICVISNVMTVKAFYPEIPLTVDAAGCAGVTPDSHKTALAAMKMCQVDIRNEG